MRGCEWDILADWHTHTRDSDGLGGLVDNARAAARVGLNEMGVSDHGPASITAGVLDESVYLTQKREARLHTLDQPELTVLVGAEANMVDLAGGIDLSPEVVRSLDFLIVAVHPGVWPTGVRSVRHFLGLNLLFRSLPERRRRRGETTKALIECLVRHPVDIVAHPGLRVDIDTHELARWAEKTDAALEINAGHSLSTVDYISIGMKAGVSFVCSSDAHTPERVGRVAQAVHLARRSGADPASVRNTRAGFERRSKR